MNWIALLKVLGEALAPLIKAYAEARKLAAQNGVTAEQLAEADARWTKHYEDPLAGQIPPVDPPVNLVPYLTKFPAPVASNHDLLVKYRFAAGSQVCAESENSEWMVVPRGQPTLGAKVLRYVIAP